MRLLLVAEDVPNRDPHSGDGSSMISYELLTRLPADVDVELVSFRGDVAVPAEVAARCLRVHLLGRRSRPAALLRSAGSLWEVGACERATDEAARLVAGLSVQHDVTLLHGPHVAFLAASLSGPAVLQVVDPWSIRTRMESVMAGPVRRRFLGMQARRLEKAERSLPEQVTLLTVGLADAVSWSEVLGRPVTAVSNGVTVASPVPRATVPTVCFAGSLDYPPHVDSARRLVLAVAPLVWEVLPQARFVLAGRRPTADVLELAGDRVEVRADVPSLPQELARAHVAAFADRFGVGVRNTVREALAAGVPVVATPVAARGIAPVGLVDGLDGGAGEGLVDGLVDGLILAGTDQSLADEVLRVLTSGVDHAASGGGGPSWDQMVRSYLGLLTATARLPQAGPR